MERSSPDRQKKEKARQPGRVCEKGQKSPGGAYVPPRDLCREVISHACPPDVPGGQQRVAIAQALASKAPVILADDLTGNLDEDTAQGIKGPICLVHIGPFGVKRSFNFSQVCS